MAIATKKTGMVILIGVLVLGVGVFVYKSFMDSGPAFIDPSDQALVIQGKEIYTNNCASCHGAELQGQPDWRTRLASGRLPAPPHDKTGHTWHHPDSVLFEYTKLGGKKTLAKQGVDFQSGMPGFGDELTDAQIWNILAFIKSTWPDRQREVQAARSEAE